MSQSFFDAFSVSTQTECSISMCYKCLKDFKEDNRTRERPSKVTSEEDFIRLMTFLETQAHRGFESHPKMTMLQELINEHLKINPVSSPQEQVQDPNKPADGKIMVFIHFRDCVEEIVALLNQQRPMIYASRFIGQGTDKHGRKGINQTEQIDVRACTRSTLRVLIEFLL